MVKAFFTNEKIIELTKLIVAKYFVLDDHDIEKWKTDPEQFYQETLLEQSNAAVRQVCRSLFKAFIKKHKLILGKYIVKWFQNVLLQDCTKAKPAIEREALYHAVGLGYFHLHTPLMEINFNLRMFYSKFLRKDLTSRFAYLTRRSVWLVAT
eukprot:UN31802